jgi:hypothetical protein
MATTKKRDRLVQATSDVFTAVYPNLITPNEYEGKKTWQVKGVFEPNDPFVKKMKKLIDEGEKRWIKEYGKEERDDVEKWSTPIRPHKEKDEETGKKKKTGKVEIIFKSPTTKKDHKTGKMKRIPMPVFDRFGGPVTSEVWGGSKLQVAFLVMPYQTPVTSGIQFRLVGVKVLELVTEGMGGVAKNAFDFEEKPDDYEEETSVENDDTEDENEDENEDSVEEDEDDKDFPF